MDPLLIGDIHEHFLRKRMIRGLGVSQIKVDCFMLRGEVQAQGSDQFPQG
jgi:hypothetical protein